MELFVMWIPLLHIFKARMVAGSALHYESRIPSLVYQAVLKTYKLVK